MEILIIGIIIVALMVYVSTKIKKNAAEAFKREVIETDEFYVEKPDGLMHPLRDKSEFAFEAFSKEFGDENLRNYWKANAELVVYNDRKFKDVCAEIKNSAEKLLSEGNLKETPEDQRICLIEGEQTVDEVKKHVFWKIVESISQRRVYEFRIFVLEQHLNDFSTRAQEMIASFRVK